MRLLQVICLLLAGNVFGLPRRNSSSLKEDGRESREYYLYESTCQHCRCGMAQRWTRIVGGSETEINEYPWMAALSNKGTFFCGGTLINDRYVLTAAHCVSKKKLVKDLQVILSEHNRILMDETMTEIHNVDAVIKHPGYNPSRGQDNDLALIRLKIPVVFRFGLLPACLPPPDVDFAYHLGTVAGWGVTHDDTKSSEVLNAVQVPILTYEKCLETDYKAGLVTVNMFCAGDVATGGVDSCQGDSGGSLLVDDDMMRTTAVGIVSWGYGCGQPNRPGVYTRINRYLQWIEDNTWDACKCI